MDSIDCGMFDQFMLSLYSEIIPDVHLSSVRVNNNGLLCRVLYDAEGNACIMNGFNHNSVSVVCIGTLIQKLGKLRRLRNFQNSNRHGFRQEFLAIGLSLLIFFI